MSLVIGLAPGRRLGSWVSAADTLRGVSEPAVSFFPGRDGVRLAFREVGVGRPLVLLHGLTGDATFWLRAGHAERIAAHGYRVILPDFRGHGRSGKPPEAAAYPPDVLTDDGLALVDYLGLADYDLGGYSLGGRIVVRMLVRGAEPGRAIVAGQGLREVLGVGGGAGKFLRRVLAATGTFEPGSAEEGYDRWLRSNGEDPAALLHVLDSIVDTPVEPVREILVPTLVVVGADDERAASARELVPELPHGRLTLIPADHATAAAAPELAATILDFLGRR